MAEKLFLLFLILSPGFYSSAQRADADTRFNKAVDLYKAENYSDALAIFNNIIEGNEKKSKITASIIFKGKILLQQKKYLLAEKLLRDFTNRYPESRYSNEAFATLAEISHKDKRYLNSFNYLLSIIESGDSTEYLAYAKDKAEKIALEFLSEQDLRKIYDNQASSKTKPFLLLLLGRSSLDKNNFSSARKYFNDLSRLYPDSPESRDAELEVESRSAGSSEYLPTTLIGVMLPLKIREEPSIAAEEILEGIKFAVSEFNSRREDKIGLIIRNTANDEDKIREIKEEFNKIDPLKAIIGPIFSSEVSYALKTFKDTDFPIISPTATDNDLIMMNENFFQANPNFIVRAKAMAQYVYYVENKRRVGVMNSIDGYSPLLAAVFIEEFEKLGGTISVKSTYKSNSVILTDPISVIAADSLLIEGLYLPLADKIDATYILSQMVQTGFYVPIYGNQDWFLAKGFETSSQLSNGLIFESDYFLDYNDGDFRLFSEKFIDKTKTDINRNILYGYDTAKYLITAIRNIGGDRDALKMKMKSGLTVAGYHNNISFDEGRVNRFLNIIRYRDGVFELVDKFRTKTEEKSLSE